MGFLSAAEIAELWGISERSVRNYCATGRVPGAFLVGKTWNIPADAVKPSRKNAKASSTSPLLSRLIEEKTSTIKGGIYHKLQVELTYNSNHIEGSKLSLDQTIGVEENPVHIDDIVETQNHFRAIDYVIDHAKDPLTEVIIKELHRILKTGTTDSAKDWFAVGGYKHLPNEVGGRETTLPENVAKEIKLLLKAYNSNSSHSFEDIVDYHVRFERIHPFQDGNGRVGRLIMLKECLAYDVVPFVISDDMKSFYYRGLSKWDKENGYLLDTCLTAQDRFKATLDYFRIPYGDK